MNCLLKCWLEKMHNLRGVELSFILGQNAACSPGGSPSVSSERWLQRGSGGRSTCKVLGKEGFRAIRCWLRASLVAQLVKNPPKMQETWVRSLGWEDPLEKGKAIWRRNRQNRLHPEAGLLLVPDCGLWAMCPASMETHTSWKTRPHPPGLQMEEPQGL